MKLESGALYRVKAGADTKETKTLPMVRVKTNSAVFKMGISEEFTTQPTTLAELETTNEISATGFYNSASLLLIDYLGFTGTGIVIVKGLILEKI